MRNTEAVSKWQ